MFHSGGQTSASASFPGMILDTSGNFGIGTINRASKLCVNGNIDTTGSICFMHSKSYSKRLNG